MKYFAIFAVSTAILTATPAFAGGPVTERAMTPSQMKAMRVQPLHLSICAPTFQKSGYPGATLQSYRCTTAFIKCPPVRPHLRIVSLTAPEPVVSTSQGIRFVYRCIYEYDPS